MILIVYNVTKINDYGFENIRARDALKVYFILIRAIGYTINFIRINFMLILYFYNYNKGKGIETVLAKYNFFSKESQFK